MNDCNINNYRELINLINEYEDLIEEQKFILDAWDNGSAEEQAENDPSFQFEKELEIEAKQEQIIQMCKTIVGS